MSVRSSGLLSLLFRPLLLIYQILQYLLARILAPSPPKSNHQLRRPKIAIIGAGITGVSSAAHCVGHGFDVHIFEARDRSCLGGIWARVNDTSGLQIHSIMYRFFPSVQWKGGYPNKNQIVSQVTEIWKTYGLERKTTFDTKVEKVYQDEKGRWIVNSPENGVFEGVIAAVGTCGDPKRPHIPGQDEFQGEIYHSSELTGKDARGKKMLVIGGGASAVEALEFATHEQAEKVTILARSEKWIIPRNPIVDILLAFNVFGQETFFTWIPEYLLKKFFYRDLVDMAPTSDKGLFTTTPMVNSDVMTQIRNGKADWLRGDIITLTRTGLKYNKRAKGVPKNGPGQELHLPADIIVLATGYTRPSLSFLPSEMFVEPYSPPNWYLQTFAPAHPSICANNCTYVDAIGAVGNWHIGIYTRILLMFLLDPLTRPSPYWMKTWIEMTRVLKSCSPIGAFDFFTYSELVWWFTFCVAINPFRWKWAVFVFLGVGIGLPKGIVKGEDWVRNGLGRRVGANRDVGKSF